jgi:hypothetical protein
MVKALRNEIGGQVLHEKIQEALNIEFVSLRENIDTGGPLGRAMVVIVGAIAELVKSLIVERVRAGMRRAKLEGRRIGRAPLNIDRPPPRRSEPDGSSEEAPDLQSHCLPLIVVNESEKLKKSGVPQIGNQERVLVDGNNS